jgi:hypothetical protein
MDSIYGKKISVITLIVAEKMEIYSHFWAEILGFFLTWLGLPTVKISAKSVTSIEQRSAGIGRGLRAMPHKYIWSSSNDGDNIRK